MNVTVIERLAFSVHKEMRFHWFPKELNPSPGVLSKYFPGRRVYGYQAAFSELRVPDGENAFLPVNIACAEIPSFTDAQARHR